MRRARILPVAGAALLALGLPSFAAEPAAQPAADVPRAAPPPVALDEGARLLLTLPEGQQDGVLVRTSPDTLTLDTDAGLRTVPLGEVESLSERRRPVGRAALWGGGLGLVLGAVLGCNVGSGIEYGGSEECVSYGAGVGGAGLLLGLSLGAAVGVLLPYWERLYARSLDGPLVIAAQPAVSSDAPLPAPSGPPLGELRVLLAGAQIWGEPAKALGGGARLQLLGRVFYPWAAGPHAALQLGPELAVQWLKPDVTPGPGNFVPSTGAEPIRMVSSGVLMRGSVVLGPLSPALLLGLSLHFPLAVLPSIGAGVDWTYAPGLPPLALEVRWHELTHRRHLTLGLGTRFAF